MTPLRVLLVDDHALVRAGMRSLLQDLPDGLRGVKVIILSMHTSEEYVLLALRAGAAAYLIKDSATSELELALKCVMRGETYLSPAISRQGVGGYGQVA